TVLVDTLPIGNTIDLPIGNPAIPCKIMQRLGHEALISKQQASNSCVGFVGGNKEIYDKVGCLAPTPSL
ncbi:hypothetical protein BgiBS90_032016, partial [Biomphalaria glabrata]